MSGDEISPDLRGRLAAVADALLPAAHGMPSASEVGVAGPQLDRVLAARPDLAAPLARALSAVAPPDVPTDAVADAAAPLVADDPRDDLVDDPAAGLRALETADPEAHHALVLAIAGGYYLHEEVRRRIGYPGQRRRPPPGGEPEYVRDGLLDAVVARGPVWRDPAAAAEPETARP
jgi:hypothetical protein